jgi:predicted Zn-dependent protease
VLAHEIEHVVQRHVLSGFIRDALLSGLWAVSVRDYSGLLAVDPSAAFRIVNLKFSRGDEADADRAAVDRLHAAGISHRGLLDFFERLRETHAHDAPPWLSTHPATADRVEGMRRERDVPDARPALEAAQFRALKVGCSG